MNKVLIANLKDKYTFIKYMNDKELISMCRKNYYNNTPSLLVLTYDSDEYWNNPDTDYWYSKQLYQYKGDFISYCCKLPTYEKWKENQ